MTPEQEKKLEEIFGTREESEIKCNFFKCAAGMGVAGMLSCFLKGDYTQKNCEKFKDEDEFYKEWENKGRDK